ncbi:mitochondrial peptide methionine sulfoxide reductase isoform X4 [Anser cygnoides]|uniref:mitochondrial peptide methionine sulfoxide reductase isoform X4 n=1 Tax=Anser cygnoides TaxID=8845 RepID=UPI0034D1E2C0
MPTAPRRPLFFLFLLRSSTFRMGESASRLPLEGEALPGRSQRVPVADKHHVNGNRMVEPFPEGTQMAIFGKTGHTEAVRVVYQPENISFEKLLKVFWENHDPTQGMRQGNDFGTQYRSAIYTFSQEQMEAALKSKEEYQKDKNEIIPYASIKALNTLMLVLTESGFGAITTEIREAPEFYYAEDYHQQYLSKNPDGYCGLGGTGISCPIGIKK